MARVHSPLQIQGAVGTIVISGTQRGGQRAYLKPHFNKKRWLSDPRLFNSRASAIAFGGAAMCGSAIYNGACYGLEGQVVAYAHNKIMRRLRLAAEASIYTQRYGFEAAQAALRNLDLSPEGSPTKEVRILPLGPAHAPTHFRVQGLREAAARIKQHVSDLQCRVVCRSMAFPAVAYDAAGKRWTHVTEPVSASAWQSHWLPIDLVPADGLLVPIPQQPNFPDAPQLHFAIVEWRQVASRQLKAGPSKYKSADRKPRLLRHQTVVRLAAFTVPLGENTVIVNSDAERVNRRYRPLRTRCDGQGLLPGSGAATRRPPLMETRLYLALAMRGEWIL